MLRLTYLDIVVFCYVHLLSDLENDKDVKGLLIKFKNLVEFHDIVLAHVLELIKWNKFL